MTSPRLLSRKLCFRKCEAQMHSGLVHRFQFRATLFVATVTDWHKSKFI